jgi:hypothetical protein
VVLTYTNLITVKICHCQPGRCAQVHAYIMHAVLCILSSPEQRDIMLYDYVATCCVSQQVWFDCDLY